MTQSIFEQHDILDQLFEELKRIYLTGQAPRFDKLRQIAPTLTYAEYEVVIERFVGYVRGHEWQQYKEHEDKLKSAQPTWPQDLCADALSFEQEFARNLGKFLQERERKMAQAMDTRVRELELITQDLQTQLKESNARKLEYQDELSRANAIIERLKAIYNTQRTFMSQSAHDSAALEFIEQALTADLTGLSPELKALSARLTPESKATLQRIVQVARQQSAVASARTPALPELDAILGAIKVPTTPPAQVTPAPAPIPNSTPAPAPTPASSTKPSPSTNSASSTNCAPTASAHSVSAPAGVPADSAAAWGPAAVAEALAVIGATCAEYLVSKEDADLTSLDVEQVSAELMTHQAVVKAQLTVAQLKRLIIKSMLLGTNALSAQDLSASDEDIVAALSSEQDKFFARAMLSFARLKDERAPDAPASTQQAGAKPAGAQPEGAKPQSGLSPATAIAVNALVAASAAEAHSAQRTAALLERPVSEATAIVRSAPRATPTGETMSGAPLIDMTKSDLLSEALAPAEAIEQLKARQEAQLKAKEQAQQAKIQALNAGPNLALGAEGKAPMFSEPAELINSVTPQALPREEGTILQDIAHHSGGDDSIAAFAVSSAKIESLASKLHDASMELSQAKEVMDATLAVTAADTQGTPTQNSLTPVSANSTKAPAGSLWEQSVNDIWVGTEGGANVGAQRPAFAAAQTSAAGGAMAAGSEGNATSEIASVAKDVLKVADELKRVNSEKLKQEKKQSLFANSFFNGVNEPVNERDDEDDFITGNAVDVAPSQAPESSQVKDQSGAAPAPAQPHNPAAMPAAKEHPRTLSAPPLGPSTFKQELSQNTAIIVTPGAQPTLQRASESGKIELKPISDNTALVRSQAPQAVLAHAAPAHPATVPALGNARPSSTSADWAVPPSRQLVEPTLHSTEHTTIVRTPMPALSPAPQAPAAPAVSAGASAASAVSAGASANVAARGAGAGLSERERACLKELSTLVDLKLKQRMKTLDQVLGPSPDGSSQVALKSLTHFYQSCLEDLGARYALSPVLRQALQARMEQDLNDPTHQGERRLQALAPVSEEAVHASLKTALAQVQAQATASGAAVGAPQLVMLEPSELEEPSAEDFKAHLLHGGNTFTMLDESQGEGASTPAPEPGVRALTKRINPKKVAERCAQTKEYLQQKGNQRSKNQDILSKVLQASLDEMRGRAFEEALAQFEGRELPPEPKPESDPKTSFVLQIGAQDSDGAPVGKPLNTSFTLLEADDAESALNPAATAPAAASAETVATPVAPAAQTEARAPDLASAEVRTPDTALSETMASDSALSETLASNLAARAAPLVPPVSAGLEVPTVPELPQYWAPVNQWLQVPQLPQLPAYYAPVTKWLTVPTLPELPAYYPPVTQWLTVPVVPPLPPYYAPVNKWLTVPTLPQLPPYYPPVTAWLEVPTLPDEQAPEPSAEPVAPLLEPQAARAVSSTSEHGPEFADAPVLAPEDEDEEGLLITPASAYSQVAPALNPLNTGAQGSTWGSMTGLGLSLGPSTGAAILGGALGSGFKLGSGSGR